MQGRFNTNHWQ